MTQDLRFLIVDDHRIFLSGLRQVITSFYPGSNCTIVDSAKNALDLLDRGIRFDLMLVDIRLPNIDGFELTSAIRKRRIHTPVLALSGEDRPQIADVALERGATSFLPKEARPEALRLTIDALLNGESGIFYEPEPPSGVAPRVDLPAAQNTQAELSESLGISSRQFEILQHMAKGMSNKEIAQVLAIAEPTVKTHLAGLFRILNARNRTACVNYARNLGLISGAP